MAFVLTDGALEANGGKAGGLSTVEVKDIGPMKWTVRWRCLHGAEGSLEAGHRIKRDNLMISGDRKKAVVSDTFSTNVKRTVLAESVHLLLFCAAALTMDTVLFLRILPHLISPLLCSRLLRQSVGKAVRDGLAKIHPCSPLTARRAFYGPFRGPFLGE